MSYSGKYAESQVREVIRSLWYKIIDEGNIDAIKSFELKNILWLIFAGILLILLFKVDISGITPSYEKLGFGVAFLVWLVASVSTCLAVTWGIIIGYTESIVDKTNGWKTQLGFHMGRLITFTLWGFILGMIGQSFSGSVYFNWLLSIIVGFVLAYLGMQLLGIFPNISQWWFHLPMILSRNITKLKNPKYSPWVGAFTFLLPCGFTQGMMVFALSSHDPLAWAIVMGGFALWTLPVLLAIGLGTEYIKDHLKIFNPLIASLLLVFGIFTMMNGWRIIDAMSMTSTPTQNITSSSTTPLFTGALMSKSDREEVSWSHGGYSFSPTTLILQKWKNYRVVVMPESDGLGCKYSVILPGVWEHYIKKWEKFTIDVDGSEPKTIRLVCGSMGMRQGEIVVQ